jgi:hypothetical protein
MSNTHYSPNSSTFADIEEVNLNLSPFLTEKGSSKSVHH